MVQSRSSGMIAAKVNYMPLMDSVAPGRHDHATSPDRGALGKEEMCTLLASLEPELRAKKVVSLSLFGSIARDEAHDASDIDVVINTTGSFGLLDLSGVMLYLEEQLGRPVDIVHLDNVYPKTPLDALQPTMRATLLRDLTSVF